MNALNFQFIEKYFGDDFIQEIKTKPNPKYTFQVNCVKKFGITQMTFYTILFNIFQIFCIKIQILLLLFHLDYPYN